MEVILVDSSTANENLIQFLNIPENLVTISAEISMIHRRIVIRSKLDASNFEMHFVHLFFFFDATI